MKIGKFYIKIATFLAVSLFLAGCESKQLDRTSALENKKNILILDEDNYINQAKYHYARYSQIKQQVNQSEERTKIATRPHPGAKLTRDNKSDLISVKTENIDENIDMFLLTQNETEVKVLLNKNIDSITISFDNQKKSINEKMTLAEFKNFKKGLENE